MIRNRTGTLIVATGILGAAWAVRPAQRVPDLDDSRNVSSPRPLFDLAARVQSSYAQVVTYEDPVWVWRGDLEAMGENENAKWGLRPGTRAFSIPPVLDPRRTPMLSLSLLEGAVDSYHQQT